MKPEAGDWVFFRRALIVAAVVCAFYAIWQAAGIFLLAFAAALIAVLLSGASTYASDRLSIRYGIALALALLAAALIVGGIIAVFGTLTDQLREIFVRVPAALDAIGQRFGILNASQQLADTIASGRSGQLLSNAASLGYSFVGGLADLVLVVLAAVYLAADPKVYQTGLLKLFPRAHHHAVADALDSTVSALRRWFLGQLVSMLLVGLACSSAFWLIGLPSPVGLGLIAGLTNFVPVVGPIVGAMPALLLSFGQSTATIIWTAAAILAVQQLEGNVIMPIVQRRMVRIPPAVLLFSIAIFGVLFGWLGVLLAVPLAVACAVLIGKLWIEQALGGRR